MFNRGAYGLLEPYAGNLHVRFLGEYRVSRFLPTDASEFDSHRLLRSPRKANHLVGFFVPEPKGNCNDRSSTVR